jgi:hypothetical protein
MKIILIVALCVLSQTEIDPCEALVPIALKEAISKQYSGYRIAHVSDYPNNVIKDQYGSFPNHSCLAVACADVDGDGRKDYAMLLVHPSGHVLLIAGRNTGGKIWRVSTLSDFGNANLGTSYVDIIKAGDYQDIFALNPEAVQERETRLHRRNN